MSWEGPDFAPPPPPPPAEPESRPRGRLRLFGIALVVAVVGATAGFVISRAGPTLASTTAATPKTTPSANGHGPSFGRGGFGLPCASGLAGEGFGPRFGGFCGGETGTVTKISGSTLTLRTLMGTVTVTTTPATRYSREEQLVSFGTIRVGDVVAVRGARSGTSKTAGAPIAATAITIEVPTITGRVQSVSGGTITVVTGNGQLAYITTSGATTYHGLRGAASTGSAVKAGVYIVAQGNQPDLSHFTADTVQVLGTMSFAQHDFPGHNGFASPRPSAAGKPV